jgi:hypothetical protein
MMLRLTAALTLGLAFTAVAGAADEKKPAAKGPTGSWTKSAAGFDVTWRFKAADKLTFKLANENGDAIELEADYTVKDGVLHGTITKSEGKGAMNAPPKDEKFSFKFEQTKEKLVVKDVESPGGEEAAQLVSGEYKPVKD